MKKQRAKPTLIDFVRCYFDLVDFNIYSCRKTLIYIFTHEPFFSFEVILPKRSFPASIRRANITLSCFGMQNMQFVDYYRQYADEDSEESREEVAADKTYRKALQKMKEKLKDI